MLCAAVLAFTASGAWAEDFAYADSYGNLVIRGAAGYKRILVGRGGDAERVNKFLDRGQTRERGEYMLPRKLYFGYWDCYRPGVFVKGRSYMYGLADGEMPVLARCR
ncbi:MAG: hypothetical protein M9924_08140 [Rhizobiaceae bacterium]|nr:hypothetical protein [Rhizobiaceae bacterium]